MPAPARTNYQQMSLRLPRSKVKWIDGYAKNMGLSRNQLFEKLVTGLQASTKDMNTQGTFLHLMSQELEATFEAATLKQAKKRKPK